MIAPAHRRSNLVAVILLAGTTLSAMAQQVPAPLPEPLRAHIGSEAFTPLSSVKALPDALKVELARLFGEKALELAEPGALFQVSDAVGPERLPWRRLIAAGCAVDHCLVHYERGGLAHVHHVVVLSRQNGQMRFVWGGAVGGPLPNVQAVRDTLAAGKVLGLTGYW
jgi:hypothetical protein